MAEEQQAPKTQTSEKQTPEEQSPQNPITFHAQYVKDFSFENPNAPASVAMQTRPEIDINVDVQARAGGDDTNPMHEVTLKISVSARAELDGSEKQTFVTELDYAGLVTLTGVPEEHTLPVLLIEVPRILFPFARKIIADATVDGGFPPLMMHPIDFAALFKRKYVDNQARTAEGTGTVN